MVLILVFALFVTKTEARVMSSWKKWNGIEASSGWQWKKYGTINLSSGIDVLQVAYRETGVKLDKLLITTDLNYRPTGKRKTTYDEKIYLEAESASNQAKFNPFKVKSSSQASGGQYIEVSKQKQNSYIFVPRQGRGKYKFNLSGTAVVWMRVYTPVASNDSFWLKTSEDQVPRNSNKLNLAGEHYYGGVKPTSDKKYKSFRKAKVSSELRAQATNKKKIDLSQHMPPPGDQGMQGSCTAWATAYAYKTYQEKFDHNWSVDTKKHQFSPAYVYNQIRGEKAGAYMYEPFKLMKKQGVCPLSLMPYKQFDYQTQPNQHQREVASKYKLKSWGTIEKGNVNQIKSHLAGEDPVSIAIPIYPDFKLNKSNRIYDDTSGELRGYHAITLVGYNDRKDAFKFINSWGQDYGFNGYGWISYGLVRKQQIKGYLMTDIRTDDDNNPDPDPDPDPEPKPKNIALNKPMQCSSSYSNYTPSKAVDGKIHSFWAARANRPQWILIDLKKRRNISKMKLRWSSQHYPHVYYIMKWARNSRGRWQWKFIKYVRSDGKWDTIKISNRARFVLLRCTNGRPFYTLHEWKIYGE